MARERVLIMCLFFTENDETARFLIHKFRDPNFLKSPTVHFVNRSSL